MSDLGIARRAGILVGGQSRRMGGEPKGLLPHPTTGRPLVLELSDALRRAGMDDVVLVGVHTAYAHLDMRVLADATGVAGPLAGLISLLADAPGPALVLACDMPYVDAALLRRLAHESPDAVALMPSSAGGDAQAPPRWEPLIARWSPRALPTARAHAALGQLSLQALATALGAAELALHTDDERGELRDWDEPSDRGPGHR